MLRVSNKHMLYKVFSIDDSTKFCLLIIDVIMMTQQ